MVVADAYCGYPGRSDYQPVGFQGYNDGYVDKDAGH